jgi:predicted dehydrogenase
VSKTLKVGIIGLGRMGGIRFRELQKHPQAEVVCGADPDENLFAGYPGVRCSTKPEDVLNADIDAIVVCTPNRFTPEMVVGGLERGLHVLCEKPPGRTLDDVHRIREAEARHPGLALKFGFNHRYHAGIQEAKRIIHGGRLGHLLWMRGVYGKAGGPGFEESWRSDRDLAGGGILLDQGIHMLDLFRFFCGDFTEVKSMVSTSYWDVPVEDNAFALLRDDRGRTAMLHSSSTQWKHRFTLELYLSKGYLSVNGILSSTRSYGDETISVARNRFDEGIPIGKPTEEIIYFDTDPSWELEIRDFVRCALTGSPVESGTSEDALKVMELIYAIYRNDESFMKTGNHFLAKLAGAPKEEIQPK